MDKKSVIARINLLMKASVNPDSLVMDRHGKHLYALKVRLAECKPLTPKMMQTLAVIMSQMEYEQRKYK